MTQFYVANETPYLPLVELSFDDGQKEDQQIIEILRRHNFGATFYIPINSWGYDHLEDYFGFKIGAHTVNHPSDLKILSSIRKINEIVDSKVMLEDKSGHEVTSFCPPRGRYDDEVVQIVKEAGFLDMRTTEVLATSIEDPYKKHTTIHVFNRKEYDGVFWMEKAKEILQTKPSYFHLWGHAKEIIENGQLYNLDIFLNSLNEYLYSL